jgi:uncharacterized protein YjdB
MLSATGVSAALSNRAILTIGSVRGESGSTVHVPATLATGGYDIATILLSVSFDSTVLEVAGVSPGETIENANKTLDFSVSQPGTLRVLIYGGVTTVADGALFAMEFNIRSGVGNTALPLQASEASAATPAGSPVGLSVGDGQIAVGSSAMVTVTPNPGEVGVGEALRFDARSTDPLDISFIWTTGNPTIATVSSAGLVTGEVTGISAGTVSIYARGVSSGVSGTAAVTVVYSTLVSVTPNPALMEVGGVVPLTAVSESQDDTAFTWWSTNPAVASVAATGDTIAEVTGNAAGTAYVTALGNVSGLQGATRVVVTEEPMVLVTPDLVALFVGESFALSAASSDASDTYFVWETSDAAVVSVSANGVVTALSEGAATVTATGGATGLAGGAVITVGCSWLSPPTNVRASDGEYNNGVLVQWDPVSGTNIEYRVYRYEKDDPERAAPLGDDWQSDVTFLDETAEPPLFAGIGCYELPPWMTKRYYYWVVTRGGPECVSEFSDADEGYRGDRGIIWGATTRAFPGDILVLLSAAATFIVLGRRRSHPACAS